MRRFAQLPVWVVAALSVALLVGGWLRLHDLATNPPELFEDELSGVASAWSLFTTGHDVGATNWPFLTTQIELKQPLYFLLTIPSQLLFGQTTFAARLPAALLGVGGILLVAWLSRRVGYSWVTSTIAAALYAVVPLAVHYGRIGWEPAAYLPMSLLGLGLLWRGLERASVREIVVAAGVLALGAYSYHPALLMNALLAGVVVLLKVRRYHANSWHGLGRGTGLAIVLLLPYLWVWKTQPLFSFRTAYISVFHEGFTPEAVGNLWRAYWEQWNPQWLFLSGDDNLRNHPGMAMLFAWMAPFLLLGLVRTLRRRAPADLFVLALALLGPLPAALTSDTHGQPQYTRGLLALPGLLLLCGLGATWAISYLRRQPGLLQRAALAAAIIVTVLSGTRSYGYYFTQYPLDSADDWRVGVGAAYQAAAIVLKPGELLCVDTGVFPALTVAQYEFYYLRGRGVGLRTLEDPVCAEPGSVQMRAPEGSGTLLARVRDDRGVVRYELRRQ